MLMRATTPAAAVVSLAPARRSIWPGLALSAGVALVSIGAHRLVPALSPLIIALIVGVLMANTAPIPAALQPGIQVSCRRLLRLGIVVLGLQLSLRDIAALGWATSAVVVAVVAIGILATLAVGRALGVPGTQRLLIACGFSICGAAAVAGVSSAVRADDEDVALAVGLVVLYGTVTMFVLPPILSTLAFSLTQSGVVVGGSIHEVAQVVAAGGAMGPEVLAAATVVKLARVVLLAPVILAITLTKRRRAPHVAGRRPAPVPLFVIGFIAASVVATTLDLPSAVTHSAHLAQTMLLSAAMFALGTGLRWQLMRQVGVRPLLLGAASTAIVVGVAFAGARFMT